MDKSDRNGLNVIAKVFEWLSRDASKSMPFTSIKANDEYRNYVLNGISAFTGKRFTKSEMMDIYSEIGNRVDHQRTIDFIRNGYDMKTLGI